VPGLWAELSLCESQAREEKVEQLMRVHLGIKIGKKKKEKEKVSRI
jgi:hypothetical protein